MLIFVPYQLNNRIMNKITYKGIDYPTRTFNVVIEGDKRQYTIATESLSDAMGDDKEVFGSEANEIDNEIYFYVEDEVLELDANEICNDHLDEPMEFVSEEF
jgi:hypothetical protein